MVNAELPSDNLMLTISGQSQKLLTILRFEMIHISPRLVFTPPLSSPLHRRETVGKKQGSTVIKTPSDVTNDLD